MTDTLKTKIEELSESINGTCKDVGHLWEQMDGTKEYGDFSNLPLDVLQYFDSLSLECEGCDWWCEASEIENGYCEECLVDNGVRCENEDTEDDDDEDDDEEEEDDELD